MNQLSFARPNDSSSLNTSRRWVLPQDQDQEGNQLMILMGILLLTTRKFLKWHCHQQQHYHPITTTATSNATVGNGNHNTAINASTSNGITKNKM